MPELSAVNLSVQKGKSAVQFNQLTNVSATQITELNCEIINCVQCLNRNRALTVPKTALNGIEFGAVKARPKPNCCAFPCFSKVSVNVHGS